MPHQLQPDARRPLVIERGHLSAGEHTVGADHDDEMVRAYLRLIRRARGDWRHRTIAVRRADITILAEHLGWTEQQVLTEIADIVGSSRRQRAAMFAVLATGASLITIGEPVAAGSTSIGPPIAPPVVIEAPALRGLKTSPHGAAQYDADVTAPGLRGSELPAPTEQVGEPPAPRPGRVAEWVEPAEHTETGTIDDATVAVGQPPVPPALDDDGNAVAVGQPPVPPAVDDDGNAVAVGQPPVPPLPPVAPVASGD